TVAFQVSLWWRLGPFNLLIFAPRMLGHVTFGLFLASRLDRLNLRTGLVALVLWALLAAAQETTALAPVRGSAERLIDFPLPVLLLVCMDRAPGALWIARPPALPGLLWTARPLAWLGVNSYGLYIGQMLIHNLVLASFDFVGPWHLVDH